MEDTLKYLLTSLLLIKNTEKSLESIGLSVKPEYELNDYDKHIGNLIFSCYDNLVDGIRSLFSLNEDTFDKSNNILMVDLDSEEDIPRIMEELLLLRK